MTTPDSSAPPQPAATGPQTLVGAGVLAAAVTIAYASLKLYDEPVRRWLSTRLFGRARA